MSNIPKSFLITLMVLVALNAIGQNSAIISDFDKLFKLKAGYYTVGLGYEMPVRNKITIELSSGVSSGYQIDPSSFGINLLFGQLTPVFYGRGALKYYYKPRLNIDSLKFISKNEGKYFAFQSKFTSRGVRNEVYATPTILNELHWGNQRAFLGNFLINPHIGIGYAWNFSDKIGAVYPAFGLNLSYILLSRE